MNSPINIGVVGLGRLGALYARHFAHRLPGARLHSVTDLRSDATATIAAATGARPFPDHQSLLADPELDAVVIKTPPKPSSAKSRSPSTSAKAKPSPPPSPTTTSSSSSASCDDSTAPTPLHGNVSSPAI